MANRNCNCRITENIVINDVPCFVMENEKLRMTFLLGKGTDVIELLYKPKDIDFMWHSPVFMHKKSEYISSTGDSLCNFLDHNFGGWQEILPSGGPECSYKGATYGMHGEISDVPWFYKIIEDSPEKISVEFRIQTIRSPYVLNKTVTMFSNDSNVYFHEELHNLANEEMDLMWGHHPTIGEPFLDENCEIITNANTGFTTKGKDFELQRVKENQKFNWPIAEGVDSKSVDLSKIIPKNSNTADMLYITDFPKKGEYEIKNSKLNLSFGFEWDSDLFKYLWMWFVSGGSYGYPWYGRTYNIALEPWTSYGSGLEGAIENGSNIKIEKNGVIKTDFTLKIKDYDK